jgi:hypothetical protein
LGVLPASFFYLDNGKKFSLLKGNPEAAPSFTRDIFVTKIKGLLPT